MLDQQRKKLTNAKNALKVTINVKRENSNKYSYLNFGLLWILFVHLSEKESGMKFISGTLTHAWTDWNFQNHKQVKKGQTIK